MHTLYPDQIDFNYHEERLRVARNQYRQYPCPKHLSEVARAERVFEESGICIPRYPSHS
jgi:hypothetical protein